MAGSAFCDRPAVADGQCAQTAQTCANESCPVHYRRVITNGTLGYGPPGTFPGFQGFGLGYHLGYGYGGQALGPGAEGGYPFYGGPGYPHCPPLLNRGCGIRPFPYFGGPGYPTPEFPHFFGGIGPLVADKPVVSIGDERYDVGYGGFTGAVPYPESVLAPFTTAAGSGESSPVGGDRNPSNPAPAAPPGNPGPVPGSVPPPAPGQALGIDAAPVTDDAGTPGMKIAKVYPGSPADKAGLHPGDVLHSMNGYVTTKPSHIPWIIAHATTEGAVTMKLRAASDQKEHAVNAVLR
jgi:hypothetical protein